MSQGRAIMNMSATLQQMLSLSHRTLESTDDRIPDSARPRIAHDADHRL
jgi:hypothetical protein